MFQFSSIEQYHAQLLNGETSCVSAVNHFLGRIDATTRLNAFVHVYREEAIARAERLDAERSAGKETGPLHGVVIAIKDVIAYKDHPLTAASNILKGFNSIYSATAIERLLAAGAIIIGHCNCDEFAMGSTNENSVYGNVLNAADESRVPGGSSGGSAVAVQAGLCMVSLGSDTGGSVRQPADFCGIVGLKPGYGRISRYGLIAYASSFDQIGIFGITVNDVALMLSIIAGPDEYDATAMQQAYAPAESADRKKPVTTHKLRFAFFEKALRHQSLDPVIAGALDDTIDNLKANGHKVEAVDFEFLDYIVPAYYVLTTAEASSNLSRFDGVRYGYRSEKAAVDLTTFYKQNRSEGFGREVQRRIMLGTFVLSTGYYDAYFTKALQVRRLLVTRIGEIFSEYDFLLLPNSPTTAFRIGEKTKDPIAMYLADIFTVLANLTGVPAISLPLYKHPNGMPFGLQLLSKKGDEVSLLSASEMLMQQPYREAVGAGRRR